MVHDALGEPSQLRPTALCSLTTMSQSEAALKAEIARLSGMSPSVFDVVIIHDIQQAPLTASSQAYPTKPTLVTAHTDNRNQDATTHTFARITIHLHLRDLARLTHLSRSLSVSPLPPRHSNLVKYSSMASPFSPQAAASSAKIVRQVIQQQDPQFI